MSRFGALAKKYFDSGEPTRGMLGACLIEHLEGRAFSGKVLRYFDRELLRHYSFHGAQRQARGKMLDAAWEVAAYYRAHNAYGSERKACRALERRCPEFTARQYQNAFRKAVALYDTAAELVSRDAKALMKQTDVKANKFPDFRDLVGEIRQRCPGFRLSTYRAALNRVFLWHHLM